MTLKDNNASKITSINKAKANQAPTPTTNDMYAERVTDELHRLLALQYNNGMKAGASVIANHVVNTLNDENLSLDEKITKLRTYCTPERVDSLCEVLGKVYEDSINRSKTQGDTNGT